ncbi:hypothetical protein FRB96_009679 [Tulasnella sp. 330]|nr:hypothetical protein FRB96_009679 [Tulasnella sp. 330]KAG8883313.1 hypothetical protein FRB97_006877 [Tulasnella sp. 331]KAG8888695.1 hypothetical protein FRB98_007061 [Tulasnella sp. 332]
MTGQNQQARRLSQRRGSMAAPDPFLQHEVSNLVSSSSRITIVRVPSGKDSTPPSPGTHPRDSFSKGSDRDPGSVSRRSSWGSAKSGSSEPGSAGRGRGRMTFAFSSFTPIDPPSSTVERGNASTSGPPSPVSFKSKNGHSLAQATPLRAAALTPQQLYEVAQQATHPGKNNPISPIYGYGGLPLPANTSQQDGGIQPAPFVPLPSEVFLPFIQRPQEVCQLLATPQTGRLFALLASTFPQESGTGANSRPSSSMGIRPQHTGGSTHSTHIPFNEIPDDPKAWTFSELSAWIRYVTRQEANDREWVRKIRLCINSRSEVLWQRFAGALGVPAGFEDEEDDMAVADEEDFSGSESRFVGIGRTDHSNLGSQGPADDSSELADNAPGSVDSGSVLLNSEFGDFEDEYEDSSLPGSFAVIEPITASSLPLPPSASGLTAPPTVPAGELHALSDLREEEEEGESSAENNGGGGTDGDGLGLSPNDGTASKSPLPKHLSGALGSPAGSREYVPRTPSPLAVSATLDKVPSDQAQGGQRPSLHLATPTPSNPTTDTTSSSQVNSVVHAPSEDDFDFGEPDPNAEPIQGLRIMNEPMTLYGASPATASKLSDANDNFASSPAQYSSSRNEYPNPQTHNIIGLPAVPGSNRQRAGSNPSNFRPEPKYRTQSFGAYHSRRMSGTSITQGGHHLGAAGLTGNAERGPGNPLFPTSFAGLSIGPTLSVNNPRLRHPAVPTSSAVSGAVVPGRHAGISLGGGMHHTPRPVAALRQQVGRGQPVTEYAVSESDQ